MRKKRTVMFFIVLALLQRTETVTGSSADFQLWRTMFRKAYNFFTVHGIALKLEVITLTSYSLLYFKSNVLENKAKTQLCFISRLLVWIVHRKQPGFTYRHFRNAVLQAPL